MILLPPQVEELLERLEPDFLGYEATYHSEWCYTVLLLTLDYKYKAYRCHRSYDDRWTINALDVGVTFRTSDVNGR